MLDDELKAQLQAYLERLRHPIQLTAFADAGEASQRMRALLQDVVAASDKVTLADGATEGERVPSFAIHRPDETPRVRFAGLPMGHEFTSLVLALLHVGGHPPREEEDTLATVKGLSGPLRFETFFSQSCQNCPDVVQSLNLMAALNPNIEHVAIDGADFQEEVAAREVMAVPTIFVNGERFGQGRMELSEILGKLDSGASERAAAELNAREPYEVLVLGGGPAGAAAAVYAARKGIRTGLVAERFGGQLLDTNAVENYISVLETDGPKLAGALEAHVNHYEVDVVKLQRAAKLTPAAETGGMLGLEFESGAKLQARSVILAPGARWRDMGVPGEQEYRTRGVTYCPHCDGPLFKGKRVAVIGGGNSGIEAAIDLAGVVDHVTVLEFMDELKADAVLIRKLNSLANVDVIKSARTTEVRGDGKQVVGLTYEDRQSGEMKGLDVAGIFVQIGLLPNTEWLKGTLELAKTGEIIVDARGATSLPGVFAAGDATTVPYKQIIIAAGDGAKAALGAFDHLIRTTAPAA